MVGTWMQIFAQNWVLTSLTKRALVLAAINCAAGVPVILLTLLGGSFADRYDKRRILYIANIVQICSACTLGWLIARHEIAIWHVFIAACVLGVATAFETPAVSAFVPELVGREEIRGAIALDRSVFHLTRFLGPSVGGWLIGHFGESTAYFLNAASFLPLIAAIVSIAPRAAGAAAEEEKRRSGIKDGLAYVKSDAPTRSMILLMVGATLFVSPFLVILMLIYSRNTLGLTEEQTGWLMGISGIGSFAGSLGLLYIRPGRRAVALRFSSTAIVLGLAGLAAATGLTFASCAMVCMTLGLSTNFGLANIVIQERAPEHMRGRISSVAAMSFFGLLPFSGLLMSALMDWLGARTALGMAAGCFAVYAARLLYGVRELASAPRPVVSVGTE